MKLKKLFYSIAVTSLILPTAISVNNVNTVQASTQNKAISKKSAINYAYKTTKKFKHAYYADSLTKKEFKEYINVVHKKHTYTTVYYASGAHENTEYKVSRNGNKVHVHVTIRNSSNDGRGFQKVDKSYYNTYGIKRNYTFNK